MLLPPRHITNDDRTSVIRRDKHSDGLDSKPDVLLQVQPVTADADDTSFNTTREPAKANTGGII